MFRQTSDLLNDLHDILQRSSSNAGNLLPFWTSIAAGANTAAYWDIVNAFTARGFSETLINQWDRGAEFQRAIGIWWCLTTGLSMDPESYDPKALEPYMLDRRIELSNSDKGQAVLLTIAGISQDPDLKWGQATSGVMNTSGDMFGLDPCDPRVGRTTRF